ncbi:MAG: 3-phosphoshikimate 1-carboxyvinyltransferase [Tepidisphaeraceae bacterium]|jgi:3-phosphoshikimate 1-carboxyvinyltransferase
MSDETIRPVNRPFAATITPPGSKSITNRALVLAALAAGTSTLSNVLFADDTHVMLEALRQLGFELDVNQPNRSVALIGRAGAIPFPAAKLFCGNSGTTLRFLTALCALGRGEYVLDGVPRMRQRPIGELSDMLRHLGVRTRYLEQPGFPPILVHADQLPGGLLLAGAAQSSQFLSAILMVSPYARHEVRVDLIEPQTSWPYVALTMRMMDDFGSVPELVRDPATHEPKRIIIPQWKYSGRAYVIEPDATNASYFLAAAAIHPGSKVTVHGLGRHSLQGDIAFADVLRRMGAAVAVENDSITVTGPSELNGIDVDLSGMPDTAQTLAVAALFANGRTAIRGLGTLRVKETDRLAALNNELTKLGAAVSIEADSLQIDPPLELRAAEIATYDDHRMAMSFALAATKSAGILIKDAECVNKTYPNYFDDLRRILIPA